MNRVTAQNRESKEEHQKGYIFPSLGIYGLGDTEDIIIAGLVTGEPVLLVGTHGSAKTLLAERIAASFGLKFHAYDASKALWEDVIGFPNPESLKKGIVDYTPTEISIWDKEFILIDEISRANPQMQNKWLEVIRSRRVMGKKLKNLKYIFAAMNPIYYSGAVPLDDALAGRFSIIVEMPSIDDMEYDDIIRVIEHVSAYDMPHVRKGREEDYRSKELLRIIDKARGEFPKINQKFGEKITKYVSLLAKEIRNSGYFIDGRRVGMIRRGIISYLSVLSAKGKLPEIGEDDDTLYDLFGDAVKYMLPTDSVVQGGLRKTKILYAHYEAVRNLKSELARKVIDVFFIREPEQVLDILEKEEKLDISELYSDIMNKIDDKMSFEVKDVEDYADAFNSLLRLQRKVAESQKLSPEAKRQVLEFFQKKFFSTPKRFSEFMNILREYDSGASSQFPEFLNEEEKIREELRRFQFTDPSWNLRLRIILSSFGGIRGGLLSMGAQIKDIKTLKAFLKSLRHITFKNATSSEIKGNKTGKSGGGRIRGNGDKNRDRKTKKVSKK